MKRFIIFLFLTLFIFNFSACKTFSKSNYSFNDYISDEISKIENIKNYSDETIKTLSIIYRTNLNNNYDSKNINSDPYIKKLVESTNNKTLKNKITLNINSNNWTEKINKSFILEFFNQNNFSLANISDIKIINDKNNNAQKISIAQRSLDFEKFKNHFNLPSNNNIKITTNDSFFIISGYGKGFNFDIDILKIENLSKKGLTSDEILESLVINNS